MSRRRRPRETAGRERAVPRAAAPAPTSVGRRRVFRALLALLPAFALLALELLLRAAGYGVPASFVLGRRIDGQPRLLSNPRFTWPFFDPAAARVPPPFSLPERKPPAAVRVFVLGSSAAQGDPEPGFGLARQLEILLQHRYPGAAIEVVNAAVTAVNSHYVYAAARGALRLSPDLLVVYEGHNEVVGPYGAGSVFGPAAPPVPLVRLSVAARRTRLGQLLAGLGRRARRAAGAGAAPGAWHGMQMFLDRQLPPGDPALERGYRNFERNLADLCRAAKEAGVPVVLATVAVNLRNCGPFASAEAVDRYRRGREAIRLGRDQEARRALAEARDLDRLRFRADSRTNAIVRDLARRAAGVVLVDAEAELARQAPHGVAGDESFLDHVHLNFHGNYLLAAAVAGAVGEALPGPRWGPVSDAPLPAETEVARRLVYTDLDRYNVAETMQQRLREPPFTNQPDHAEQQQRFAEEMAAIRSRGDRGGIEAAVDEYQRALAGPDPHWSVRERYAGIKRRLRDPQAAVSQLEILVHDFPQQPGFQVLLSRALRDARRFHEARQALEKVLDFQPEAPVTLVELAQLELAQGRPDAAERAARRAVALDPGDANGLNLLAASVCPGARCAPERRAEALALLERAARVAPHSEVVKQGLEALRAGPPAADARTP